MHAPQVPVSHAVKTAYRLDIDGLRAIAVLSVLWFHYGAPLPPAWRLTGGFTGVDVFFVISGFLITSRLMDDIEEGRFSVLSFYDRRIRRILPALIAMLATTLIAGRFLLMPGDYKDLAASAAAAAFGASNLFFLWNTGYFDQAAELMPLLHTWSLAVEEQFYLAWPLILLVIARRNNRINIAAILCSLVIVGFGASLLWFGYDSKAAFFTAVPRAWELALGALLVFLPPLPRATAEAATAIGVVLIGIGFFTVSEAAFPGPSALYPCLGAALVVWPRKIDASMARWLGYLSPIGLISYSLYLWHWPVWILFRIYINNGQPRIREAAALAGLSLILATLSYLFVEQPFRRKRWSASSSVACGVAASTAIFCAAMFIYSDEGMPERMPHEVQAMQSLPVMWNWPCDAQEISHDLPPVYVFGSRWGDSKRKALLWGDSNAEHMAPFLKSLADNEHISVALTPNCASIMDGKNIVYREPNSNNEDCARTNKAIENFVRTSPDVETIILSGSWSVFIDAIFGGQGREKFESAMADLIHRLLAMGRDVVLITTAPHWRIDPVPCALLEAGLPRRPCDDSRRHLSKEQNDTDNKISLEIFARLKARFPKLRIIDPGDPLCASGQCLTHLNGEFLFRDVAHFRRNLTDKTNADMALKMGLDEVFRPRMN